MNGLKIEARKNGFLIFDYVASADCGFVQAAFTVRRFIKDRFTEDGIEISAVETETGFHRWTKKLELV